LLSVRERDVVHDNGARDFYREAHAALNQGDHGVLIMIAGVLRTLASSVVAFWR